MKILIIVCALFACGLAAVIDYSRRDGMTYYNVGKAGKGGMTYFTNGELGEPITVTDDMEDMETSNAVYEDESMRKRRGSSDCPTGYPLDHTVCDDKYNPVKPKVSGGVSAADIQIIVDKHNELRSNPRTTVTARAMCKVYWDPNVAAIAQHFAYSCPTGHDAKRNVPGYYLSTGQNIARRLRDWDHTVAAWYNEVVYFRFGHGTVDPTQAVGHYTQVVKDTTCRIGCGFADCPNTGKTFVCNYVTGQQNFKTPFVTGPPCAACPNRCTNNLCDTGGKMCYNQGVMDYNTNTCNCLQGFTGPTCEQPMCKQDMAHCGVPQPYGFTKDLCTKYGNVRVDCPVMCDWCTPGGQPGPAFLKHTPPPTNLVAGRGQTPPYPPNALYSSPGTSQYREPPPPPPTLPPAIPGACQDKVPYCKFWKSKCPLGTRFSVTWNGVAGNVWTQCPKTCNKC